MGGWLLGLPDRRFRLPHPTGRSGFGSTDVNRSPGPIKESDATHREMGLQRWRPRVVGSTLPGCPGHGLSDVPAIMSGFVVGEHLFIEGKQVVGLLV